MATGLELEQEVCETRVETLKEENEKLKDEMEKLNVKNDMLSKMWRFVKNQLQERNDKLKKRIKELNKEIKERKSEIEVLEKRSSEDEEKIRDLSNQVERLKLKIEDLEVRMEELQEERKLNDMIIGSSRDEGKICSYSCLLDTLYWICKEKLPSVPVTCLCGHNHCHRKLEKILTHNAHENIDENDLDCHKLMYILVKSDIVQLEGEFDYPQNMESKHREKIIHDAWQKIVEAKKNKTRLLILGKISFSGRVGHVVVCDLEARPEDESKVVVHDPQNAKVRTEGEEEFKRSVIKDIHLQLYTVNFQKFEEIIKKYYPDNTLDAANAAMKTLDMEN